MTRFPLHLMRHGAPQRSGLLLGHLDIPVTAEGVRACADRGRGLGPFRLVSSDLQRARACAEALAVPEMDPRWRELDFGDWDGLAPAGIDPTALGAFWADPDANPPPGGERWSQLVARIEAALQDLPPEPTLVVTHGGPMRAALHILLGLGLADVWRFDLPYAALLSFNLSLSPGHPPHAQLAGLVA